MRTIIFSISLLLSLTGYTQTKRALFLGNSYTGANNLPNLIYQLALSNGDTLIYDSNTPGGYQLIQHSTNATSLSKIQAQDWDYVVLQEQSQKPSFSPAQVANDVYPYADVLVDSIYSNNPCTEPVFYMTWGRENGDANNCPNYPPVCTYEGMQDRLRSSYLQMTNDHDAICAPAGSAWWYSRTQNPGLGLYTGDGSHPNINGSYLTACVFYATMWRKSPVGLSYTAGISSSTASFLQQVAHTTVFDSLDTWRIGTDDVKAGFEYTVGSSGQVSFSDTSVNATDWQWAFGDGALSTLQSPNYTYSNPGNYTVVLIADDGCTSDTVSLIIDPFFNGISEQDDVRIKLFPNPVKDYLQIESGDLKLEQIDIFDVSGKMLKRLDSPNKLIDFTAFPAGTYTVRINDKYVIQLVK